MKKTITLVLASALCLSLISGCGKNNDEKKNSQATDAPKPVGSFTTSSTVAGKLPAEAQAAFDEANPNGDKKALACLGTQVVAGVNYAILETQPDGEALNLSVYYKAPGKAAVLSKTSAFNLSALITNDDPTVTAKQLGGSWRIPEDGGLTSMPQDMATFTSQALLSYDKLNLSLLACVGKQIVSGTNYAFVSSGTDNDGNTGLFITVIYVDLKGNAKVLKVCPISVSEIVK